MIRKADLALLAAALLVGTGGCVIPIYVDDPSGFSREYSPMFSRTVSLERGGAIALENPSGEVHIYGWDKDEVEISAEWGSNRTPERRIEFRGLGNKDAPDVEVEKSGSLVRIRPREERNARDGIARPIRFILNVPHSVDLESIRVRSGRITIGDLFGNARIDLDEGDVRVENYSGSLDVQVRDGSVDAEILDLRPEDAVRVACRKGPVTVSLESSASADVTLDAPEGRIASDFDLGSPLGEKKAAGKLGRGTGASVVLTSLGGNVSLRKIR